jgi:hypothetical protein
MMKKNVFLDKCFLYIFTSGLPPTMMPFWLIPQKVPKIRKPTSYVGKIGLAMSWPPSPDLAHTALRNSILCARGGGREPLTWQPLLKTSEKDYRLNRYISLETMLELLNWVS